MTFGPSDREGLTATAGGVTAAAGFRAAGISAGLKRSGRPDLALVVADEPAAAAAMLTTNTARAAPCELTAAHVADGRARAVVVNSGNANACTGARGEDDARRTAEAVAAALDIAVTDVLVCSTGIIGVPLEMEPLLAGVERATAEITADGGSRAAEAIITTDKSAKEIAFRVEDDVGSCTIGGMAKGAGMIEPTMATMIAVLTTDAALPPGVLRAELEHAVDVTFNRISVDACGSTNDSVVLLASGRARSEPSLDAFRRGLGAVCADLARSIVADGEGATRVADIHVTGAVTEADAVALGRAVCRSVLVRAALHGGDPNWGRILAAMGTSSVAFEPAKVSIAVAPHGRPDRAVTVCRDGVAAPFDRQQAAAAMRDPRVEVTVDLGNGDAAATVLTPDVSPEYVTYNAYKTT